MLTTKQILTFNKENNKWYVECRKWEADREQLFRENATYTGEDGKMKHYDKERNMDDPNDDHTKHPDWPEFKKATHEALAMNESMTGLFAQIAGSKRKIFIEVCGNGWVANTYTHYELVSVTEAGADYQIRFRDDLPAVLHLTPMARYILDGIYPAHIHARIISILPVDDLNNI